MKITKELNVRAIQGITNLYDGLYGEYKCPFDANPVKFNYDSCDGAIGYFDDTIYVMFAGSDSAQDWITNFEFFKTTCYLSPKVDHGIKVHSGFVKHYLLARDYIQKVTANYKKIVVTGHSLGGATTALCAYDLKSNNLDKDITAIMFAAPRIGNRKFARTFNKIIPDAVRWNFMNDLVPKLPPFFFGYQHEVSQSEITTWKEKLDFDIKHPLIAIFGNPKDHDLRNYQKVIDLPEAK